MALLGIEVPHAHDHTVLGREAELGPGRLSVDLLRGEEAGFHGRGRRDGRSPRLACAGMHVRNGAARRHNRVRQAQHERHHHAPERHGRSGVEELPDHRNVLEPRCNRCVRVDEAADLDDVDLAIANDPADRLHLLVQVEEESGPGDPDAAVARRR